jgi:hypothetical protein
MINLEELKRLLEYNPNTGIFINKVTRSSMCIKGKQAGCKAKSGYRQISKNGKTYLEHRLAWFYVYGIWPENTIDHINGIRDDNRICNLRDITLSKNIYYKNSKGYRKMGDKYQARITVDKKEIYLGTFKTKKEAKDVYQKAKELYFG